MAAAPLQWHAARARRPACALAGALLALLAGCSSTPRGGSSPAEGPPGATVDASRDGAPIDPPADLAQRPDPEPRVEPIRSGGPNKPYEVLGQRYTPLATDAAVSERGLASWYGTKFHGRPTASGEIYDMYASSAAHRTMPIPSYALVRNPANGREVVVRVNDRGPFAKDRIIDLSYTAALKLGVLRGVAPVEVRRLTHDEIRSARWRGETAFALAAAAPNEAAAPYIAIAPVAATNAEVALSLPAPTPATTPVPQPASSPVPLSVQAPTPGPAPAPAMARSTAAPGFWVQLGAFSQRQGAFDLRQQLMRELAWLEPWLAVFDERSLFKLQAGPFASRTDAQSAAERIRAAAAVEPLVLQRR